METGGCRHHVTVTRTGSGFAVNVDGRTWNVDVARIDAHTLSLLLDSAGDSISGEENRSRGADLGTLGVGPQGVSEESRSRGADLGTLGVGPQGVSKEAVIVPGMGPGQVTVYIDDTPVPISMNGHRRWSRGDESAHGAAGPLRINAPMPGKVVRVLVDVGEKVSSRQPLLVVEAMKMENELRASRDGTVTEIHAREGMLVEAGALLAVVS
jgi:biotin carboxyl carrier protein